MNRIAQKGGGDTSESRIKPENYITIQGWMVTELGLSGSELIVYALIYGFSQDGESGFLGSQSYLGDWIRKRREAANKVVARLERKGLICKVLTDDGAILYTARKPCERNAHPPVNETHTPCERNAHNNNIYINNTNIDILNSSSSGSRDETTTTTTPSVEEVTAYFREQGYSIDPQRFWDVNQLRDWKNKNGKPLEWRVVARLWEAKEKKKEKNEKKEGKDGSFDTDEFFAAAIRRTYDV